MSKIKQTLSKQLEEAVRAKDAMEAKLAPLRAEQEKIVAKMQPLVDEKAKIDAKIREVSNPKDGDSHYDLAMTVSTLTTALGGRLARRVEAEATESKPTETKSKK